MPLSSGQQAVTMRNERLLQMLQHQHAAQQAAAGLLLLLVTVVISRQGAQQQQLLQGLLWHQQQLLHGPRQRQQRVATSGVAGRRAGARLRSSCLSSWWGATAWAAGPSSATLAGTALRRSGRR
jgi:hypothetical protein